MSIKKQFIVVFTGFSLITTLGLSLTAIFFIKEAFDLFIAAPNVGFAIALGNRLFIKAMLGFLSLAVVVSIIAIPIGLFLFKKLTKPYLSILNQFTHLARYRLDINKAEGLEAHEKEVLKKYYDILLQDYEKIKEFEKAVSFKEGARMLLHEIKNPLTPLKLTAQNLMFRATDEYRPDLQKLNIALNDVETVLQAFKQLVQVDFKPKEPMSFLGFFKETCLMLEHKNILIKHELPVEELVIISDPGLLRMVIMNLVNNGLEANVQGFEMVVNYRYVEKQLEILFITKNVTISDPNRLFKVGVSSKGEKRGYGLFICKQITDYLDHSLDVILENNNVIFRIIIQLWQKF